MVHVDLLWSKVSSWCGDGTGGDWNGVPTWWQSFSPPEWTHFEFGYLVYRAGLNKMGAIALEKKQTRWRQRPRVMVLNTWFMISTGLIPVTVAISSMRISWEDPKNWQFNPMPGLCRNMFSLDMLSLPHCGGRIWSPSEKKTCCVCTVRHGSNTQSADNIDGKRDPPNHIQCGAPKIAKLVYNSSNYDLRYI